jgi:hypothetical protein
MEYPRTAAEFNRQFSTEEACWDYLVKLRWPEGFRCPDCGSPKAWLTSNRHGYRHTRRIVEGRTQASTLLPRVHRVASLLKRWLLGTHQGAVSREHLDSYLDEFAFRFNRRTSQHRGKLFYRLVQQAVAASPAPYDAIIKHVRGRQGQKHNR